MVCGDLRLQRCVGQRQEGPKHTQCQNPPLQRTKARLLMPSVYVVEGKAFPGQLESVVASYLTCDQVLQRCDRTIQRKQMDDTVGDNLGEHRVSDEGGLCLPQCSNVIRQPTAALHNNDGPAVPYTL